MPSLFWLDVTALSISLVISAALTLTVFGAEPKRGLNQTFALFTTVQAAWAVLSLFQRLGLWLGRGDPLLLAELITVALGVVGPCLLVFTARYLDRRTRWIDLAAVLGLVAIAVICIPLFRHKLVLNARLHPNGTTLIDVSTMGLLVMPLPLLFEVWAVALFWQDRHRIGDPYMALSAIILPLGYIVGGVINVHVPVTSITHTASVVILGYGVVSRQLFNPLRDRTLALQREIEEWQHVEAELQFRNAILEAQQEASPDGILVVDADGAMISFNQRFVDMWGIPDNVVRSRSDELAQQSVLTKLVDPEAFLARIAHLYEQREQESRDELKLVDGRMFERHSAPTFGADGHYYGRVWTFRDITEAEVAAQELLESEDRYRSIVEYALAGMFTIDDAYHFAYVNDELCRMLGYSREELVGMDFREVLSDKSRAFVAERYVRRQRGEQAPSRYELELMRKDGELRHAEMSVTVIRDRLGRPRSMGQVFDMTERKRAEDALRKSEEMLRLVFQNAFDGISVYEERHPEGRKLLDCNARYAEIAGQSKQDLLDMEDTLSIQRAHRHETRDGEPVETSARDGVYRGTFSWIRPDGKENTVEYAATTVTVGDKRLTIGVDRDVSEWVRAQQELRRHRDHLEELVRERTAELESFAYSVSHDLRAPLRAMDGFSRITLAEHAAELSPGMLRYLHAVRDNVQHMSALIDGLLAFSRLGRQDLREQMVQPEELVRQVLADLLPAHEGRQIEVTVGDLPACHADPILLRQVYANLLSNAFKFTRAREVAQIEVGAECKDDEQVYYVHDNGVGFDPRYTDNLFGVFQRLHSTQEYEGTGVGLAIVQRIVRRHGGRVWADAEVDRGATFCFTLA